MKKVSYKRFRFLVKIFSFILRLAPNAEEHPHLYALYCAIVPLKWRDFYQFPYYYFVNSKEHCPELLKSDLKLIGNYVTFGVYAGNGLLTGFAVTIEDYYYVMLKDDGTEAWNTCIDKISLDHEHTSK